MTIRYAHSGFATRSASPSAPMRTARSKPSSARSTMRLLRSSSTRTCGWACWKVAVSGAITQAPKVVGALTRSVPEGCARSRSTEVSAQRTCSSTRLASS